MATGQRLSLAANPREATLSPTTRRGQPRAMPTPRNTLSIDRETPEASGTARSAHGIHPSCLVL